MDVGSPGVAMAAATVGLGLAMTTGSETLLSGGGDPVHPTASACRTARMLSPRQVVLPGRSVM